MTCPVCSNTACGSAAADQLEAAARATSGPGLVLKASGADRVPVDQLEADTCPGCCRPYETAGLRACPRCGGCDCCGCLPGCDCPACPVLLVRLGGSLTYSGRCSGAKWLEVELSASDLPGLLWGSVAQAAASCALRRLGLGVIGYHVRDGGRRDGPACMVLELFANDGGRAAAGPVRVYSLVPGVDLEALALPVR